MKAMITIMLMVGVVGVAAAYDLGNQAPVKVPGSYPENTINPALQGGDTFATATVINSLPYSDSGTTAGYTNDYDAVCPYTDSTAPDVVYMYVATTTGTWNIDLCGSAYDTKLYVMDAAQTVLACNDDYYNGAPCGTYVSLIENFTFVAGSTYYVVVDGYGGAYGEYTLQVVLGPSPCEVPCPAEWHIDENEPSLVDDYVDTWNGGCNAPGHPFQTFPSDGGGEAILCGVSGWYLYQGTSYRDTDWFILSTLQGEIGIVADVEQPTYLYELDVQGGIHCDDISVLQVVAASACQPASMTIVIPPGYIAFLLIAPTVFAPPSGAPSAYAYVIWFTGVCCVVPAQTETWSTVKALFE